MTVLPNLGELSEVTLLDMAHAIKSSQGSTGARKQYRISVLRNITVDPIETALRFLGLQNGLDVSVYPGEYDNAMQEALDGSSPLYAHNPDTIIICLRLEALSPKLLTGFLGMSSAESATAAQQAIEHVELIVRSIRSKSAAMILVNSFELPKFPVSGVLDYQSANSQTNTIRRMNLQLVDKLTRHSNVYIVDLSMLVAELGYDKFIDERFWHIAKNPYTFAALKRLSAEYWRFVRARLGMAKKCLVLDCDNTLWGGIIGEDGLDSIKVGASYPGSCYRDLQEAALALYQRGILLALCSKNNKEDVLQVLAEHPDMVLRKEHFATMRVNWQDKATNLKEIATELNIGLDSLVFVDDNPSEIELILQSLPEIRTLQVPRDLSKLKNLLSYEGLFDTLAISHEDRNRSAMMQSEVMRRELRQSGLSLDEYLQSLQMRIAIRSADDFTIPRIAQLTQKTNQFNLTTRRYTESEIRAICATGSDVLSLQVTDRFGDNGIVGVCIVTYSTHSALVDSFLLSCRVIGRGIEVVLLNEAIRRARSRGCGILRGEYIKTAKNSQVRDFYQSRGFHLIEQNEASSSSALEIEDYSPADPTYFERIVIETESPASSLPAQARLGVTV